MLYDDWCERLRPYEEQWGGDVESRWAALLTRLHAGDVVTGTVIAKAHFGAWLDIGAGFPALIELPYIRGLTPERYRADEWCAVGTLLSARVRGFGEYQVRLEQVRPHWTTITATERARLEDLLRTIPSIPEAIATLGPPSETMKGQSVDRSTGLPYSFRVLVYDQLSDTAQVWITEQAAGPEIRLLRKRLGEQEIE